MKCLKYLICTGFVLNMGLWAHAEDSDSGHSPASAATADGKVPVPTGKYVTGGVLGTTIGYGIGHGIQGRWSDDGWKFTLGDSIGTAMLLGGLASCKNINNEDGTTSPSCSDGALIAAGLGVFLGFHIWEIVDVWSTATPVEDSGPKVFLLPNPKAPGLGIAWNF